MTPNCNTELLGYGLVIIMAIILILFIVTVILATIAVRKRVREVTKLLTEIDKSHKNSSYLNGLEFHRIFSRLFMDDDQWIIDTGNWENANMAIMLELIEKIKAHPFIWRCFFHY